MANKKDERLSLYLKLFFGRKILFIEIDFKRLEISKAILERPMRSDFCDIELYGNIEELQEHLLTAIKYSDDAIEIKQDDYRFALSTMVKVNKAFN